MPTRIPQMGCSRTSARRAARVRMFHASRGGRSLSMAIIEAGHPSCACNPNCVAASLRMRQLGRRLRWRMNHSAVSSTKRRERSGSGR